MSNVKCKNEKHFWQRFSIMTSEKRTCTIGVAYKYDELKYIKSVFKSDNIIHSSHVFVRNNESTYHGPKYISMPQLYEKDAESYYYSICANKNGSKMKDIPVHILLVDKKDNEYGKYLRILRPTFAYLSQVLFICMDYSNKKLHSKQQKQKQKYYQKGQVIAYKGIFKQQLWDQRDKILKKLKFVHFNGQKRFVTFDVFPPVWDHFAIKYLRKWLTFEWKKGIFIWFTDLTKTPLSITAEFYGTKLKNEDEPEGTFEAINVEYRFDTVKYSLNIYYDTLWVDLKKVPHLERMPEII
eukprot:155873_1